MGMRKRGRRALGRLDCRQADFMRTDRAGQLSPHNRNLQIRRGRSFRNHGVNGRGEHAAAISDAYVSAEADARTRRVGIWGSTFETRDLSRSTAGTIRLASSSRPAGSGRAGAAGLQRSVLSQLRSGPSRWGRTIVSRTAWLSATDGWRQRWDCLRALSAAVSLAMGLQFGFGIGLRGWVNGPPGLALKI